MIFFFIEYIFVKDDFVFVDMWVICCIKVYLIKWVYSMFCFYVKNYMIKVINMWLMDDFVGDL